MYSENIEKICALCFHAQKTDDPFMLKCDKNDMVRHDFTCKKFQYDIFKKKVRRRSIAGIGEFTADDFSID